MVVRYNSKMFSKEHIEGGKETSFSVQLWQNFAFLGLEWGMIECFSRFNHLKSYVVVEFLVKMMIRLRLGVVNLCISMT